MNRNRTRPHWTHHSIVVRVLEAIAALAAVLAFSSPATGWAAAPGRSVSYGVGQDLTGVFESDAAWGDFDGDGDLDLVLCGEADAGLVAKTYENQSGTLVFRQDLVGVDGNGSGCLAWGDYDNDGDLDLFLAGTSGAGIVTRIYENDGDGNLAVDAAQVLTPVTSASAAWGDPDRDGDLDLYVQGHDGTGGFAVLYENDGGLLVPADTMLGLWAGSADWGDYDGDAAVDLLVTGTTGTSDTTLFYHNAYGALVGMGNRGLPDVRFSDAALADYDVDGDLDVAITGESGTRYARIYRNDGWGTFDLAGSPMSIYRSSCVFGDADGDGDMDVAFYGYDGASLYDRLYENTGAGWTSAWSFDSGREGSITFADVDDDGDLDYFMTGAGWSTKFARVYTSSGGIANAGPSAPANLEGHLYVPTFGDDGALYLSWDPAHDAATPDSALYYAIRVGTTPGGHELVSGVYGSPLLGNVGQVTQIDYPSVPGTIYYWSVRAIDSGLRAGPWAAEQMICPEVLHHVILDCVDDATVDQFYATTTFDSWIPQMLHVGGFTGAGDIARAYVKFYTYGSIPAEAVIQSAHLVAECVSVSCGTPFGVAVWEEGIDNWNEATLTWNNAPTLFAPGPSDQVVVPGPGVYAWDVTGDVAATVDFNLTLVLRAGAPPEGTNCIAEFWSKDQSNGLKPQLEVWYSLVDTDVGGAGSSGAPAFRLAPNAPNPFNPATTIRFALAERSAASLRVYDVAGRLVRVLADGVFDAGADHAVVWDGRTESGRDAPSGVYFYRLTAGPRTETRKMVLMR